MLRSIASLPAVIFLLFVIIAFIQLWIAADGYDLSGYFQRLNIDDLDTIRTTLAAVITGVFTLTIFAYTMVMNVIDRSISSYSPRLLPLILSERYHQEILGVGAGTIAHSTILLLGVAEPPDVLQPPPLAVASAGLFAVSSLILFIYFIHRVSRSIHVNVLLYKSYCHTKYLLEQTESQRVSLSWTDKEKQPQTGRIIRSKRCGYLNSVNTKQLLKQREISGVSARLGGFIYVGDPIFTCLEDKGGDRDDYDKLYEISENEPYDVYATGFRHLVEVAIKAASPALNDQATSLTAMHYLVQLFEHLATIPPFNTLQAAGSDQRIYINTWTAPELIQSCYQELRQYLAQDPWGQRTLRSGLLRIERAFQKQAREAAAAVAREELALLPAGRA
ncbi:DUF2254 family protein [Lewinella sp. IMCC34191]|uniref:DUF2254 family protein n=1 Tax=Lewinella sp. IMCC34191 TaxID=2259172 RepID=UPI0013009FDE|nr:DUF2254 family protein [Lewinella sp. IMCC34191]